MDGWFFFLFLFWNIPSPKEDCTWSHNLNIKNWWQIVTKNSRRITLWSIRNVGCSTQRWGVNKWEDREMEQISSSMCVCGGGGNQCYIRAVANGLLSSHLILSLFEHHVYNTCMFFVSFINNTRYVFFFCSCVHVCVSSKPIASWRSPTEVEHLHNTG